MADCPHGWVCAVQDSTHWENFIHPMPCRSGDLCQQKGGGCRFSHAPRGVDLVRTSGGLIPNVVTPSSGAPAVASAPMRKPASTVSSGGDELPPPKLLPTCPNGALCRDMEQYHWEHHFHPRVCRDHPGCPDHDPVHLRKYSHPPGCIMPVLYGENGTTTLRPMSSSSGPRRPVTSASSSHRSAPCPPSSTIRLATTTTTARPVSPSTSTSTVRGSGKKVVPPTTRPPPHQPLGHKGPCPRWNHCQKKDRGHWAELGGQFEHPPICPDGPACRKKLFPQHALKFCHPDFDDDTNYFGSASSFVKHGTSSSSSHRPASHAPPTMPAVSSSTLLVPTSTHTPTSPSTPHPANTPAAVVAKQQHFDPLTPEQIATQQSYGAQSLRPGRPHPDTFRGPVGDDAYATDIFHQLLVKEAQLCGEFAVFYHSYSYAALLYEVNAAVGSVLFRFSSIHASLPRLLKAPFMHQHQGFGHIEDLMDEFPRQGLHDHDPRFRSVALSCTSSLLADDVEAPPLGCFLQGYSCTDLSFTAHLEELLQVCGVPSGSVPLMAQEIISTAQKFGLDTTPFGGKPCDSGRAGHMQQIFVHRNLVHKYVYPALPYGPIDESRTPLVDHLAKNVEITGQTRVLCDPSAFMRPSAVRMYTVSADKSFGLHRKEFQKELIDILKPVIGTDEKRKACATGIYGGTLPEWFKTDMGQCQQ